MGSHLKGSRDETLCGLILSLHTKLFPLRSIRRFWSKEFSFHHPGAVCLFGALEYPVCQLPEHNRNVHTLDDPRWKSCSIALAVSQIKRKQSSATISSSLPSQHSTHLASSKTLSSLGTCWPFSSRPSSLCKPHQPREIAKHLSGETLVGRAQD